MASIQQTRSCTDLQVERIRSAPFLWRYLRRRSKMTRAVEFRTDDAAMFPLSATSVVRQFGGSGACVMSKPSTGAGEAIVAPIHDSLCRRIRITEERIRLARDLEIVGRFRPDVISVIPRGLEDLPSYRRLAEDGLAHATMRHAEGGVIVLAAAGRIWRRPKLKRRLLGVKLDARRIGRRVVLVTQAARAREGRSAREPSLQTADSNGRPVGPNCADDRCTDGCSPMQ
jgi:hypothetical protein